MHASMAQLAAVIPGATLSQPASGQFSIAGVATDSRNVPAGALFVALRGDTFDAHDFLAQVAESGAGAGAAAVVAEQLPADFALPAILVPNTLVALGLIANFWRRQFSMPVIGVTGSNGKTTVKEMISSVLASAYGDEGRLATRGNLNNEIGVPLTLFRLNGAQRAAVIELGMNHPGEIARLAAIAAPTIALVNNAQREHQEFMHTVEAVARENGAALQALPADGVAVFPHHDEFSSLWTQLAGQRSIVTFGLNKEATVSCTHRPAEDFGSDLFVSVRQGDGQLLQFFVALSAAGEHNVLNALAAIACCWAAGVDMDAIKRGLEAFAPVAGRLQRKRAASGATIIDDSYNANPDSVRAAIDVLAQCETPRILVLGDMGEVGVQGREFHAEIGAYAASKGIEQVLVTGDLARHVGGPNVKHFEQFDALLAALDAVLAGQPEATVLIKGSRFMQMERAVRHLVGTDNNNNNNNKDNH